jgi:hypothetical protein
VSCDGTDFRIHEQKPFWKGWYSYKYNGPGLRYEVAICIQTGAIVWINGPFPCGKWPDIRIFRNDLKKELDNGEKAEADNGYQGEPRHIKLPTGERAQSIVRARHETVNGRFKNFGCLSGIFRHGVAKHSSAFRAVAAITQLALDNGEPLFSVNYDDRAL